MSSAVDSHYINYAASYVANGNKLGVVLLQDTFASTEFRQNAQLCQWLASWGQRLGVDSVMVMRRYGSVEIAADVFEPWGQAASSLLGSWSTMCGNGMMAATLFYEEHIAALGRNQSLSIQTASGVRTVTKLARGCYSVCMGSFTHMGHDLSAYVRLEDQPEEYLQSRVPSSLTASFSDYWSIGLSGDRVSGTINGEPHVVLINKCSNGISQHSLRRIAMREGPRITKNRRLFPQEINANFVVVEQPYSKEHGLSVLACTHERGLGNSPDRSVTGACGTGATAIGATLYRLYNLPDDCLVRIAMPAGNLRVYRRHRQFYLVGSAERSFTV
jgi:diaminopimelate epimerase